MSTRWRKPVPMLPETPNAPTNIPPFLVAGGGILAVLGVIVLFLSGPPQPMQRRAVTPVATRGAAVFAATPRPIEPTEPPAQPAYAAPDGAQLGTIPLGVALAYRHSAYPGWAGVEWEGGVVWVKAAGDLSGLRDLGPKQRAVAPEPPAWQAAPASIAPATHGERPHDETR